MRTLLAVQRVALGQIWSGLQNSAVTGWAPAPSVRPPGRPPGSVVVIVVFFFGLVFAAVVFGIVEVVLFVIILRQNDPTVVQAGDGLRLALEPLLQVGVRGDMLRQHLDGDGAVEAGVGGLVDFAL